MICPLPPNYVPKSLLAVAEAELRNCRGALDRMCDENRDQREALRVAEEKTQHYFNNMESFRESLRVERERAEKAEREVVAQDNADIGYLNVALAAERAKLADSERRVKDMEAVIEICEDMRANGRTLEAWSLRVDQLWGALDRLSAHSNSDTKEETK
jgi:hypothetical protein